MKLWWFSLKCKNSTGMRSCYVITELQLHHQSRVMVLIFPQKSSCRWNRLITLKTLLFPGSTCTNRFYYHNKKKSCPAAYMKTHTYTLCLHNKHCFSVIPVFPGVTRTDPSTRSSQTLLLHGSAQPKSGTKNREAHGSWMLCAITANDMPPCKLWS